MKKIRNIRDLENEKLKLRVRQLELEKELDRSWEGLRNSFSVNKPDSYRVAEQKQTEATYNFKTGNKLLNGILTYGAIFLSEKLSLIAGRTVGNAAEQILGKLGQKINSMVSKNNPAKNENLTP
jgi:hypothetical protein